MRWLAALALILSPAVVLAQNPSTLTQINFTYGGASEHRFTDSACAGTNSSLQITWTVPQLVNVASICTPLKVWLTSGSCGEDIKDNDISLTSLSQTDLLTRTGFITVSVPELPIFANSGVDAGSDVICGTKGVERTAQLCGSAKSSVQGCLVAGFQTTLQAAPLKLIYDTAPPGAPNLEGLEVQDSILVASYAVATGTASLLAQASPAGAGAFDTQVTDTVLSGRVKLTGLANNVAYDVRLVPVDAAGNQGAPSGVLTATPLRSYGFWANYRRSGGAEQGGCSAATGLLPALAGLIVVLLSSRRKRP